MGKRLCEHKPFRAKKTFYSARNGASTRGIPFLLTEQDVLSGLEKQGWKCAKTGIPFDLTMGNGKRPFGPTTDRIDNARGYEVDNIQFVCLMYNMGKAHFTDADFFTLAHALVENSWRSLEQRIQQHLKLRGSD